MADLVELMEPVARGPLRATAGPASSAGVVIEDLCLRTKVSVRCDDPAIEVALGTRFGRAVWRGDRLVAGAGPAEWMVIAPEGRPAGAAVADLLIPLAQSRFLLSVVDLSHGRALVRLRGPRVRQLLARLTAFDLDDRFVPDGAAWRTSVAHVVTDVVRDDIDGVASYFLHCERSSGRYLVDTMLAAGADLVTVTG